MFTLTIEAISPIAYGIERLAGFDTKPLIRRAYLSRTVADFWCRINTRVHLWFDLNLFRPSGGRRNPVRGVVLTFLWLCADAIARGEPLAWFEELYSNANGDTATIPWADLEANPHLVNWHNSSEYDFVGKQCLKVGCGLGHDCEYMQNHGGVVTGFDISRTAVQWCKKRFPDSSVDYSACKLLETRADAMATHASRGRIIHQLRIDFEPTRRFSRQ